MTVNAGPTAATPDLNVAFVSVTICSPGSSTSCQTIDDIQVDTGSYGLRIISSVLSTSLSLPAETANSLPVLQCVEFADGYVFGPLVTANVQIAGESAANVPVQIMGGSSFAVPSDCTADAAGPEEDTVATFGANGILGLGPFAQDCGDACVNSIQPANYYACSSASGCTGITLPLAQQVANPVALFATDNNGVIIELPLISNDGVATTSGSLVFGIGTETNNALPSSAAVLTGNTTDGNSSTGNITTTFSGGSLPDSFIDSGSSLLYFNDASIPTCGSSLPGFFCPSTTQGFTATNTGMNGVSSTVGFNIANAATLVSNQALTAFNDVGGPNTGFSSSFDFGLPFFYSRNIYVAIYGQSTPAGAGPYFAY
jgi:hypothetical protein